MTTMYGKFAVALIMAKAMAESAYPTRELKSTNGQPVQHENLQDQIDALLALIADKQAQVEAVPVDSL